MPPQLQEVLDLQNDPELAIFKAIKAVDNKLTTMEQGMMEMNTQMMAEMPADPIPTDMQPMCDKMDAMMTKMNEPVIIKFV